jgi:uncharacterized protein YkwD
MDGGARSGESGGAGGALAGIGGSGPAGQGGTGGAAPDAGGQGGLGGTAPISRPDGGAEAGLDVRPDAGGKTGADAAPSPSMAGCSVTRAGATGNEPGRMIPVCCTPTSGEKALINEVFQLLNMHRMANGRSALAYDLKLEAAIQGHCLHMAQHSFFNHTAPEAVVASPGNRATLCGTTATGENIARGQQSAAMVMRAWRNSPGHNSNMLHSGFRRVGIGEHRYFWGQLFGR